MQFNFAKNETTKLQHQVLHSPWKGYPFVCIMSESHSIERRRLIHALSGCQGHFDARCTQSDRYARQGARIGRCTRFFFHAKQFETEANAWIRQQTTGKESIDAFIDKDKKLDHAIRYRWNRLEC